MEIPKHEAIDQYWVVINVGPHKNTFCYYLSILFNESYMLHFAVLCCLHAVSSHTNYIKLVPGIEMKSQNLQSDHNRTVLFTLPSSYLILISG